MVKRKHRKVDLREQIASDLEELSRFIEDAKSYKLSNKSKDGGIGLAVLMYDINRYSARILSLLRALGIPLKMDLDFMAIYKDDPFQDDEDFREYIDLVAVKYKDTCH